MIPESHGMPPLPSREPPVADALAAEPLRTAVRMREPHAHSQVELNLLGEGGMTYLFNGQLVGVAEGELAVFWGAVPHRVVALAEPARFVCLYYPMAAFLALPASDTFKRAVLQGGFLVAPADPAADPPQFERWWRELSGADPRRTVIAGEEIGLRLRRIDADGWTDRLRETGGLRQPPVAGGTRGRDLDHVARMARFVAEHAAEPIGVAEVAAAAGLGPSRAMELFRRCLGDTIARYILRQRLSRAQTLLLATDRDVARIAFDAGFGSVSRFYEAFREAFGTTPRHWRLLHRQAEEPPRGS